MIVITILAYAICDTLTSARLWAQRDWRSGGENGLLAAYRIAPPDSNNWDMEVPSNREILKQNILRVGKNEDYIRIHL